MSKFGKMKKYKIGYTQGVYDMFHIGHLNLINRGQGAVRLPCCWCQF